MVKAEFVQHAKTLTDKTVIGGWSISEKLDGHRCIWDGGISRGLVKKDIPWANTAKDARFVTEQVCTGLWSRYGNVIHAPDWWLDGLPVGSILDGEIYLPKELGSRQMLAAAVKRLPENSDYSKTGVWSSIQLYAFDLLSEHQLFAERVITGIHYNCDFGNGDLGCEILDRRAGTEGAVLDWALRRREEMGIDRKILSAGIRYCDAMICLNRLYASEGEGSWLPWIGEKLPESGEEARRYADDFARRIVSEGGEGAMVRHPYRAWEPVRSKWLLKLKPRDLATAEIIGFVEGKGRLLGLVGSLVVVDCGVEFEIGTGLTDRERVKGHISIGDTVRYTHRGHSDLGIPIETAYKGKESNNG